MGTFRASMVLLNGNIRTMSSLQPVVQAVAAIGETIVAVGSSDEIRDLVGQGTMVIDLGGRTVLPGFTDCHTHLLGYGLSLEEVDLREAKSLAEAVAGVASAVGRLKSGEWATGGRWDRNFWPEDRLPRKEDLDPISPGNPVLLQSKDTHTIWVNSLALRLAKITKDTGDPPGGRIERDPSSGEPTGILAENAVELVWKVVGEPTEERAAAALRKAMAVANRYGLVGAHICEGPLTLRALQRLRDKGELNLRAYAMLRRSSFGRAAKVGLRTGLGDAWIRVGPMKLFADGSLGSQTAAMLEPYENAPGGQSPAPTRRGSRPVSPKRGPRSYGITVTGREELADLVMTAARAGISTAIHAIGDAACHNALDAIAATHAAGEGRYLRHRLEHVQLIQPEDVRRMAGMGVIASVQPIHATADRDVADRYWGARCAGRAYAYKTLLDAGVHLAFGSDAPVETLDPLPGIYAAVARQRPEEPERPAWYPEQRLSVDQAVQGYTLGAAYASGEERLKGSLEPGKLADMVVLSQDIFTLPAEEILRTRVECTIVGGKIVYGDV